MELAVILIFCLILAFSVVMGKTLGADPVLVAGALLAGAYVGDRWSPVSTTFNLTSSLTGTKLRENIPAYVRTAAVPMILSSLLYLFMGRFSTAGGSVTDPRHDPDQRAMMILITSTYSGFFHDTELVKPLRGYIRAICDRTTDFAAFLVTSVFTTMAFCSQPPAVFLVSCRCTACCRAF